MTPIHTEALQVAVALGYDTDAPCLGELDFAAAVVQDHATGAIGIIPILVADILQEGAK